MKLEIEKKFHLTLQQRHELEDLLLQLGAILRGEVFEENILFGGGSLDNKNRLLRLRRGGGKAILTYKERLDSDTTIRRRREVETEIENPEAIVAILSIGGYKPAIIYEKRRTTWELADTQLMVDELPFGLFLEVEGDEEAIRHVEDLVAPLKLMVEQRSYSEFVQAHGVKHDQLLESRFK